MALNFPSPATNGQTWTDPTGRQWVYDTGNNSWTAKGGASGGMVYKGGIDITTAPPAGVQSGWLYVVTTGGTANAGFTGLTGSVPAGSQVVFGGPNWQLLSSPGPWARTGTELAPSNAGDSVFTTGPLKVGGTTAAPKVKFDPDASASIGTGIVINPNGAGVRLKSATDTVRFYNSTGNNWTILSNPASTYESAGTSGLLITTGHVDAAYLSHYGNLFLGGTLPSAPNLTLTNAGNIRALGPVARVYTDNTAAKAGGLLAGDIYRKADGTLMITF